VTETAEVAAGEDVQSLQRKVEDYERWFRTLDNHIRVLERERQKFSALVNYTDAGVLLLDPDARVIWTNTVFRERFDSSSTRYRDPLGLSCHQVLCRKSARCEECPAAKLFETGTVAHHELSLLMGDRFHHLYTTAIPVHSLDGKIEQGIVMMQDLSDLQVLRRSEEALRTTEQRFRSIFEQAGAGMVTIRADGSFLQVNPAFCTMLGYTESELLRKKLIDVTHEDDRVEVERRLVDVRAGLQRVIEMEKRLARRDGTPVWCHTTAVWQFDKNKKPTYSVVLVQDVSERKKAESALELSQRRWEALVHSIDGIVWEADPRAFRFSFVSKQAERILGFPVERWLSQPRFWRNQIYPNDVERVLSAMARSVGEKRGHEVEYRMVAAGGHTVWIRDTASVVMEGSEVAKLRGLMVDITERKAAEEALRQSEEQLRQAQKMEAIGRLAGGIAHDFNNLLTAITGYGDFLLKGLGNQHPMRREAMEITKAAQRAADLTGQLLAFSRQQVLQPKVIDLNSVVTDMEMMLRRLIGEDLQLVTQLGADLGAVKADPGQLQQVILNLVVNSRDAMPQGGRITVETANVDLSGEASARNAVADPGSYVMLAVIDTGKGMDQETKARLFEPFFTTKEQGKGTGLGLSTVYGIVKQSGGNIWVYSEPGHGTTFKIYLPRVEQKPADSVQRKEALPDTAPGTERILLVEDDDSVRELAREILEMNGYTVFEARNGVEALAFCESGKERLDLMITDLVMPRMGGRDLARNVAPLLPELKVLYLSGYTDSAVMHQGNLDPGSFFLQKPFTPAALAHKVREALGG
jgi:PAS domain S-box-containing protein